MISGMVGKDRGVKIEYPMLNVHSWILDIDIGYSLDPSLRATARLMSLKATLVLMRTGRHVIICDTNRATAISHDWGADENIKYSVLDIQYWILDIGYS